jgi:hypothetical protein
VRESVRSIIKLALFAELNLPCSTFISKLSCIG